MKPNALNVPTEAPDRIRRASEWLMRLQGDSVPEADVVAWLNWCAADAENLQAFDSVERLYNQLQSLPPVDRNSFLSLANVDVRRRKAAGLRQSAIRAGARRYRVAVAAIAVGLLIVGSLFGWLHVSSSPQTIEARDYRAPRGFQKAVVLADRSRLTLAGDTEVHSHFTADVRYLELRAGEAYFEVSHNRARPFVVEAGPIRVTAVGTKFNIRRASSRTIVVVTEGAVDVTTKDAVTETEDATSPLRLGVLPPNEEGVTTTVRIHEGQQAIRLATEHGLSVSNVRSAAAIAWRDGKLEYIMEPLGSVVEDVNRYTSRPIVIGDARLSNLIFTGTIFRDHADDWVWNLQSAFPIRAEMTTDGTIRLETAEK